MEYYNITILKEFAEKNNVDVKDKTEKELLSELKELGLECTRVKQKRNKPTKVQEEKVIAPTKVTESFDWEPKEEITASIQESEQLQKEGYIVVEIIQEDRIVKHKLKRVSVG